MSKKAEGFSLRFVLINTGNISRKVLSKVLRSFDKNFERLQEEYLKKYKDIDMVYCENDSEALGAINAIEQAGKKVGTDGIQIISFDATREGLAEVQNGKIAVDVECNPDFGKKIEKIIKQLEYKRDVNKEYYIGDKIYTQNKSISTIEIEKAKWSVTVVTDKIVKERVY